jgi:hypothetical protein
MLETPSRPAGVNTPGLGTGYMDFLRQRGINFNMLSPEDRQRYAQEYKQFSEAERARQNPYDKARFGEMAGPGNAATQALLNQNIGQEVTPEWRQVPGEALGRNRETFNRYTDMSSQGMLTQDEIEGIVDRGRQGNAAAQSAARRAAGIGEERAMRGARETMRNASPGQQERAFSDIRANFLAQQAQRAAQGTAAVESMAPALMSDSLFRGRQVGTAGMGQSTEQLGRFASDRLWDTSYENKFGPTPAQQAEARLPSQMLAGVQAMDDNAQRARLGYITSGNLAKSLNNFRANMQERGSFLDAFWQETLMQAQSDIEQGNWLSWADRIISLGARIGKAYAGGGGD